MTRAARRHPNPLESAMLKHTRTRMLAAALGGGWAHPYTSPFVLYADGGDGGGGEGGSKTDGGEGEGHGDERGGDDQGDGDDTDDQDDEADKDLGDKGKKALRELRQENRRLKAELRQNGARNASKTPPAKDGDQEDADTIRERAREEARAEVWGERVEAAAIAAASGRLANPQLAARLLDLSDIGENDKGRPDRDAITELIDDLLDDEPYLAAKSATDDKGRRFQGGADGGARKPTKKTAASLGEAVAAKLAGKSG